MRKIIVVICLSIAALSAAASSTVELEGRPMSLMSAKFTPAAGADREHGQGAIERLELAHREVEQNRWLIATPDESVPDWTARLNAVLTAGTGKFEVSVASEEECEKVRTGEIELQQ